MEAALMAARKGKERAEVVMAQEAVAVVAAVVLVAMTAVVAATRAGVTMGVVASVGSETLELAWLAVVVAAAADRARAATVAPAAGTDSRTKPRHLRIHHLQH